MKVFSNDKGQVGKHRKTFVSGCNKQALGRVSMEAFFNNF